MSYMVKKNNNAFNFLPYKPYKKNKCKAEKAYMSYMVKKTTTCLTFLTHKPYKNTSTKEITYTS
jgi:hypothetical protein